MFLRDRAGGNGNRKIQRRDERRARGNWRGLVLFLEGKVLEGESGRRSRSRTDVRIISTIIWRIAVDVDVL